MSRKSPSFLYRHRIVIAYGLLATALIGLLTIAAFIPAGLSAPERSSVVQALGANPIAVDSPYHLLQRGILYLFGFNTLSIKLPSLLLGLLLGTSIFFLFRRWVSFTIAAFASLIVFASTTFLSLSGTGTPDILLILYPALLLFFGTRVIAHEQLVGLFAAALIIMVALALLTPGMVYLVLLAMGILALNPHVRYGFRRLPFAGLVAFLIGVAVSFAPAVYLCIVRPSAIPQLLALPTSFDILGALNILAAQWGSYIQPALLDFRPVPLVGLALAGLALIGLVGALRSLYTARAQFIVGWGVITLVLAVLNPSVGIALFLPVVLLAGLGLGTLAGIWYDMFPRNPYARITALVPIGVLIVGIVAGSSLRYVNTSHYAGGAASYSRDLQLLHTYVAGSGGSSVRLVLSHDNAQFYRGLGTSSVLGAQQTRYEIIDSSESTVGAVISDSKLPDRGAPFRIITDGRSSYADRFYVYQ